LATGRSCTRRCAAADKRLVLIPGAGHNDLMLVGVAAYFGGDPSVRAAVSVLRRDNFDTGQR